MPQAAATARPSRPRPAALSHLDLCRRQSRVCGTPTFHLKVDCRYLPARSAGGSVVGLPASRDRVGVAGTLSGYVFVVGFDPGVGPPAKTPAGQPQARVAYPLRGKILQRCVRRFRSTADFDKGGALRRVGFGLRHSQSGVCPPPQSK